MSTAAIEAALRAGDSRRALELAEADIRAGAGSALPFKVRSARLMAEGRLAEGLADLEQARGLAPDDFGVRYDIAVCLARLERYAEAIAAFDAAIARSPGDAQVHYVKGWVCEQAGELELAADAHERAVALGPRRADALASLASIAARRGQGSVARERAGQALALDPGQVTAAVALAMADLADGAVEAAEGALRQLLGGGALPPHARAVALGLLADTLDGQDRPAEAFTAHEAENAEFLRQHAPRYGAPGQGLMAGHVARLNAWFERQTPEAWRAPPAPGPPVTPHVFLVGFPRSGTTLLGQVLGAHPALDTLDERPLLADAGDAFMGSDEALERLRLAGPGELEPFRKRYWANVREDGATAPGLVDKMPLNLIGLPVIARLFPRARILIAQRDPRDVVLSCFRRHFVVNPSNFEFLTLEGAARFYDAVMRLAQRYLEVLPLQAHVLSHEALVEDFDGQTRALCDVLGVPWSEEMRGFAERAERARINTPSAPQVARGLYREGVGQWRRYREQLAPVLPILQPWVDRFGYSAA